MTLRYQGARPVGLDWSSCNDGNEQPEVWQTLPKAKKREPKVTEPVTGVSRQRLDNITEATVIRLYRDEQKSALQVAKEVGIQSATVFKVLARHGVPSRSRSESMQLSRSRGQA